MTVSSAGPDAAGDSVIVDSDDLSPLLARFSEHQQFTHVKLLLAGISLKDSLDLLFIPKLDRTRKNHQADDTHMYLCPLWLVNSYELLLTYWHEQFQICIRHQNII